MSQREAQASIEFLVAFSIILLLFTFLSFLLYQKFVQVNELKDNLAGKRLSNSIAQGINEVYAAGEDFSRILSLSMGSDIDGYRVRFYSQEPTVFVFSGRQSWSSPLFTPNIGCTLDQCSSLGEITNLVVNSTFRVRIVNKEGKIYLEEP